MKFSDNHKRVLVNAFRHVDERLAELEQSMEAAGRQSPFHGYTMDISPSQRRMLITHIALIQESMVKFLEDQNIRFKRSNMSVARVVKTTIQFLHITFEEIRPKYLRGYGALPDAAARDLDELATRIQKLLEQMNYGLSP